MFAKPCLFVVLILAVPSIYSVSAQSDTGNIMDKKDPMSKVLALDDIMTPTITATLTSLSLVGASFLVTLLRDTHENDVDHIRRAKKLFIKAFFAFLICTIILFVFDFLEILNDKNVVVYSIIDIIISYALFGIGSMYLVEAAKQLHVTYGK